MKPFYNSHLPEQWLMRLHLKHKRPGALDARDCFIIINVSGSSCTRRSRIAPSRAHWSLKIWHERDLAGYCNLTRSVILGWWIVPNFLTMLAARGCAHVRRYPNWQCWRDSAYGIENHREKGQRKKEKGGKDSRKNPTNPRRETGIMRSKGRARKLTTGRCNISFLALFNCHLVHVYDASKHFSH